MLSYLKHSKIEDQPEVTLEFVERDEDEDSNIRESENGYNALIY